MVAHSISLMVIQASAARRQLGRDTAQAEAALATVEATGRDAMAEMRRILGVLRDDGGEVALAPQPSLAALTGLVEASTDLPVEVHLDGDLESLPPGVEVSAFRIVQEALTNVRRHAGPVRWTYRHGGMTALTAEVADDGRGASADATPAGFGFQDEGAGGGLQGRVARRATLRGGWRCGPRSR